MKVFRVFHKSRYLAISRIVLLFIYLKERDLAFL